MNDRNKIAICEKLKRTTYIIEAYQSSEKYSSGSGFCIHSQGFLITAAHVVTGRLPILEKDWQDPSVTILARTSEQDFVRYEPVACGITINWSGPLKQAIQVDLAVLRPAEPKSNVEYLEVSNKKWSVGEQVLMAGFPDELESPLLLDKAINEEFSPIKDNPEIFKKGMERLSQLLMVKSAMVGNTEYLTVDPDGTGCKELEIGTYYLDNVMHSGSSGGPVVDEQGLALGTITKRAVTKIPFPELNDPNKEVPSGSALAVSTHAMVDWVNNWA